MKILIIRTFPDILNLQSYNVQEVGLAKALVKKGHICDIVLYNGKNGDRQEVYSFTDNEKSLSFRIHWLKGYNFFKNGLMPSVYKLIKEYDMIQVHEYDQILSWDLYTRQKKPTVIYHGPYYDAFAKGYNLKCKVFDRLFLPLRKYKDVVAISKSTLASDFLRQKGFQNIVTAGVGINLENFGTLKLDFQTPNMANREKEKVILYVGKLEERRNVYFLVEVFRRLYRRDNKVKMILIGSGETTYKQAFLNSIQEELAAGIIEYRERATQPELVEYYRKASLFALASNYEIFGMVLMEAMYFGAPVISSANGGSCTLIQNGYNGYIIEGFNVEEWSESMHRALQNPEGLEELKKNAHMTIANSFTWDALADRFLEAYEQAINRYKGSKG